MAFGNKFKAKPSADKMTSAQLREAMTSKAPAKKKYYSVPTTKLEIIEYLKSLGTPPGPHRELAWNEIFIPWNVISSKRGKVIGTKFTKDGPTKGLMASEQTVKYGLATTQAWSDNRIKFLNLVNNLPKPYVIMFYYVRKDKGKFDLHNMHQLPLDLMQDHGWLDDDNADTVWALPAGYHVEKEHQGMIIRVDPEPEVWHQILNMK
jgi:hypothetical protein